MESIFSQNPSIDCSITPKPFIVKWGNIQGSVGNQLDIKEYIDDVVRQSLDDIILRIENIENNSTGSSSLLPSIPENQSFTTTKLDEFLLDSNDNFITVKTQ